MYQFASRRLGVGDFRARATWTTRCELSLSALAGSVSITPCHSMQVFLTADANRQTRKMLMLHLCGVDSHVLILIAPSQRPEKEIKKSGPEGLHPEYWHSSCRILKAEKVNLAGILSTMSIPPPRSAANYTVADGSGLPDLSC